jgi:HPt (histidine-containing phosphotransfer) domain-containing protein
MTPKDATQIDALLLTLWERGLPQLRERLEVLEHAAAAAASGRLAEASRIEALDIAHKFAGSLGMFGYDKGTEIARKLEQLLTRLTPSNAGQMKDLVAELRRSLPFK